MNDTNIHPSAVIEEGAQIGAGCKIGPFCVVGPNVSIGQGTRLENGVTLTGRVVIGEFNHIFPGVVIGAEGQPSIGALGFGNLSEAPEYELKSLQTVGGDILHTWSKVHK